MARVWFVRRRGGQWVAPGGAPAAELPFADLIFPAALQRVLVEVEPKDLGGLEFSGYQAGIYDSPYCPRDAARRLAQPRPPA